MYEAHQEGEIKFYRPPLQKVPTTNMQVFFNPQSELNRDATIVALQVFLKRHRKSKVRVCTPLAGTGVRPIRIAKEVTGITKIIAGDVNPHAVELIERNRNMNDVSEIIEVHHSDANKLLTQFSSFRDRFDVIDIDPFGSPREFFSSAIGALKPHSLLCLTATDMPVLIGIRHRTCVKRYAAKPLKTEYAHELALRILIGSIVREAASQNLGLTPLLSFSIDHYIRVFCEVREGDENTWTSVSQIGFLTACRKCNHREMNQGLIPIRLICSKCQSSKIQYAGPMWIGKLGEKAFIKEVIQEMERHPLGTKRRLSSLLLTLKEEIDGPPTYFDLHQLADRLNIPIPPFRAIISRLHETGDFASRTHFSPHAIRTTVDEHTLSQLLLELSVEG
ncbi:MAG: tRNA (guanine(10)-N(2))-dimethyltransferase [Candidatus Thorarchaeota archaeon]